MDTTIEYENIATGIINVNLSTASEPTPAFSLNSPSGLLAELYLGPRTETQTNLINTKWHTHYRE
jgi:hypothetical protein